MKNDITLSMLKGLVQTLPIAPVAGKGHSNAPMAMDLDMRNLVGTQPPPETPEEVAKLDCALALLSPDVGRGHGAFYDSNGTPLEDNWLAIIWAINGLGWNCGKDKAKQWSRLASERYTDEGFEEAWGSYDSSHPNPVGIGSLYKRAAVLGWKNQIASAPNSSRFKLIGGQQLQLLPPINWVIKGVLPTTAPA